jgi:type IV pilus assembly protein PilQ
VKGAVELKNQLKILLVLNLLIGWCSISFAQGPETYNIESVALNYLSPAEVIELLALRQDNSGGFEFSLNNSSIQVHLNYSTNEVILSGSASAIAATKKIISLLDVAPRQIIIEAKIVEVDNEKFNEIGFDLQELLNQTQMSFNYDARSLTNEQTQTDTPYRETTQDQMSSQKRVSMSTYSVGEFLKLIQQNGVGKIVNVPKIVTLNNKEGSILDGHRYTYLSKYSSIGRLFETQEVSAGLYLAVTPSLGKSGFLNLEVTAKLTRLSILSDHNPSEYGQILNNTVFIKDGQTFLLGGFKKTETRTITKRTPFLGYILPFLFSKKIDIDSTKDVLILLTPRIIDLNAETVGDAVGND